VAAKALSLKKANVIFNIAHDRTAKDLRRHSCKVERAMKNQCGLLVHVIDPKVYVVNLASEGLSKNGLLLSWRRWQCALSSGDPSFTPADLHFVKPNFPLLA
jgi:hypothetical protein